MRRSLLAVVVVSLSGCAIIPMSYRGPDTGPIATITYRNASSKSLDIALFNQSKACTGRRRLETMEPGTERTVKVHGDDEVTFEYHLSGDSRYCLTNLRFVPRIGAAYRFDTIDGAGRCLWRMLNVTNEPPQPVDLQRVPWRRGWDENSSFCDD